MFALYNGAAASGGFLWHGIGLASPCNGVELVVTRSVLNKTKRFWPFEPGHLRDIQTCFLKNQPLHGPLGGVVSLVLRHSSSNFTPKTINYCLKNRALGFPGRIYMIYCCQNCLVLKMLRKYVRMLEYQFTTPSETCDPLHCRHGEEQALPSPRKRGPIPSFRLHARNNFSWLFSISISYFERVQVPKAWF